MWDLLRRRRGSGNGGSAPEWQVNHLDKVDRKQAEKQKEERRKEKRERVKVLEAKNTAKDRVHRM